MEENTQEYINERIKKRKNIIETVIDDKEANQYIGLIVAGAIVISGLATMALSRTIGLMIASIGASIIPLKIRNCRELDYREFRIKDEIKHLEELKNGIENNESTRNTKKVDLRSLDKKRKKVNEDYSKAKRITFLSYGLTAVGIGAIIIDPALVIAVLPGLIANFFAIKNEINKYNSYQEVKRKINDLYHDIDILDIQAGNISKEEYISLNEKTNEKSDKDIDTLIDYFEENYYEEEKIKEYSKRRRGK